MPIRWDTLLTRHTAAELNRSLVGARLRAVRLDRAARDVTLLFKDRALIWRLHPTRGYLRLHGPLEPTEGDHPIRGRLERVHAPPDERLIRFDFSAPRSDGVSLIVELISTQWNALVTTGTADTVRHLLWRPAGDTRRVIGQTYKPPSPTGRAGVAGQLSLEDWLAALEPVPSSDRPRVLIKRFAWTSPLNAQALLGEPGDTDTESQLETGYARLRAMLDPSATLDPVVLQLETGPQPYPFPIPGTRAVGAETLLSAFESCADADGEGGVATAAAVLGPELLGRIESAITHATRRTASLEVELAGAPDPLELRAIGDLILARYQDIPPGAVRAHLTGFDGAPVEVRLEPGEPAHASAARYYQNAAKAERAAERLPELIADARAELGRLEALLARVRSGAAEEAEVRETLRPARVAPRGATTGPMLPYKVFKSSGGLEIRVGRGARFNDDLTFRHSSPGDVWLHARHASGAHVILRWQGDGKPPAQDLEEAATLAALHSKARTSGSVPVDWTLRKYVRKPRKSPPGRVSVERVQTLFVEPDSDLIEALAE